MINFTTDVLHNFEAATSREWLETNGIGGFACSTDPPQNDSSPVRNHS